MKKIIVLSLFMLVLGFAAMANADTTCISGMHHCRRC